MPNRLRITKTGRSCVGRMFAARFTAECQANHASGALLRFRDVGTVVVLALVLLALPNTRSLRADGREDRLLKQCLDGLNLIQSSYSRAQMEGTYFVDDVVYESNGENLSPGGPTDVHYSESEGRWRLVLVNRFPRQTPDYMEAVHVADGGLAFELARTSEGGDYAIKYLGKAPARGADADLEYRHGCATRPSRCGRAPLPSIMDSPGFSVRRLGSVTLGGREMVRLDFDLDPRPPKKVALSGHVILDPKLSYCVKEYEVRVTFRPAPQFPPTIAKGSVTYDEASSSLPRPVEVLNSQTRLRAGIKYEQRTRFRVARLSHDMVPSRDFTLAAFGLDDITVAGSGPPAKSARVVLFVVAGSMIMLSIALRIYAKRKVRAAGH